MDITHCIIGSGPAGVACAQALLARGRSVLMLDAGLELEPERARTVQALAGKELKLWTATERAAIKGNMNPTAKGLPQKQIFGSDFPYRDTKKEIPWQAEGVGLEPSLALGGFSNVWGSAMLPYRDADLAGWPIKSADLAPHYRAVTAFTGLAAQNDDLTELFPLYCVAPQPLPASRQAESFLNHLARHRTQLRAAGWHFGRSRLAIRAVSNQNGAGCNLCGFCMSGCPYGCIYNSAGTVREMQRHPRFQYRRDCIVSTLRESVTGVTIHGYDRHSRAPLVWEAGRVYLAAGVIPTAQIVLRSQGDFGQPVRLHDSQYFLCPLLLARRHPRAGAEALHTLSQVFMELNDPAISAHTIHLQLYTYSQMIHEAVRRTLGPLGSWSPLLAERLIIIQGYLHSDESPAIEMRLNKTGAEAGAGDVLQLAALPNPGTAVRVGKLLRALLRQSHRLGGLVLPPMLQLTPPGRGFHTGASLPMRAQPGKFESDCLGRPHGWTRVHAVDASVLPSVPATTITWSVMANAHRIGWETALW